MNLNDQWVLPILICILICIILFAAFVFTLGVTQ
jgi:hypothetical protein